MRAFTAALAVRTSAAFASAAARCSSVKRGGEAISRMYRRIERRQESDAQSQVSPDEVSSETDDNERDAA